MDLLKALTLFEQVAAAGSISAAARELGLSTTAASRGIAELERELGVRLLNRSTRSLSLTEAGGLCLERARVLIEDADALRDLLLSRHRKAKGLLRVACSAILGNTHLARLAAGFLEANPEVSLELELTSRPLDIVREGYDLALRYGPLEDSTLVARKLGEVENVICASPAYGRRHGRPARPEEIARHRCAVSNIVHRSRAWAFLDAKGRPYDVTVPGGFTVNSLVAIREAVLKGAGIANLPRFLIAADVKAKRLERLLPAFPTEPSPVFAVYPERKQLSAKVTLFVDYLQREMTPLLKS